MREDDRTVKTLVDRPHGRLEHAVDAVLDVHRVVLGLDVDVARPPLNGGEDHRVDQADDGADVAGEPLDGEVVLPRLVFLEQLEPEALRRILGAPAESSPLFLSMPWMADGAPTVTLSGVPQQQRQFVDQRQIRRIWTRQ